jgi:hypothetical protein
VDDGGGRFAIGVGDGFLHSFDQILGEIAHRASPFCRSSD